MKQRQSRADRTRERIIAGATECFRDNGVRESSMETIAERSGTTKPTLYAHFGSKDALFDAVVGAAAREPSAKPWPPFDPDSDLADQLSGLLNSYLTSLLKLKNLRLYRAILLEYVSRAEKSGPPDLDAMKEDRLRIWLQEARDAGVLPTLDVDQFSEMLWALVEGQLFWPVLVGVDAVQPPKERSRRIEEAVSFFLARSRER